MEDSINGVWQGEIYSRNVMGEQDTFRVEMNLGQALKGRRHDVIIASKCGLPWDDNKNVRLDLSAANLYTGDRRQPAAALDRQWRTTSSRSVASRGSGCFPYSPFFQGLLTDGFKAEDNFDENDVRSENPKLNGDG